MSSNSAVQSKSPLLPKENPPVKAFLDNIQVSSSLLSFLIYILYTFSISGLSTFVITKYYIRPQWLYTLALRRALIKLYYNFMDGFNKRTDTLQHRVDDKKILKTIEKWSCIKEKLRRVANITEQEQQRIPAESSLDLSIQAMKGVVNAELYQFGSQISGSLEFDTPIGNLQKQIVSLKSKMINI